MRNIDDFLNEVHKSSDWTSDYKIGKGLGYKNTTQVSNWRRRLSMPNIDDILAMCDHAKIDVEKAVRAVSYSRNNERAVKEAGFADIGLLGWMGMGTFAAMSVEKMTYLPYEAIGAVIIGMNTVYYVKCDFNQSSGMYGSVQAANDESYRTCDIIPYYAKPNKKALSGSLHYCWNS